MDMIAKMFKWHIIVKGPDNSLAEYKVDKEGHIENFTAEKPHKRNLKQTLQAQEEISLKQVLQPQEQIAQDAPEKQTKPEQLALQENIEQSMYETAIDYYEADQYEMNEDVAMQWSFCGF